MDIRCIYCDSENVYFSKKKQKYICEDCEKSFVISEEKFIPRKVFLSYGHDENQEIVQIVYDRLLARGHQPWIDKADIKTGSDWRERITEGIFDSSGFIAFISDHSVRNPGVCLDEIAIGMSNYHCRISPVLLEKGVTVPNSISNIQRLDMSDWKAHKADSATWESWLDEKIEQIYRVIEDEKAATFSGNIAAIQKKLLPLTGSVKMRVLLQNELITRDWLLEEIHQNATDRAYVVYGSPGTGKSVLSAYFCNYTTDCSAVYFCEWNNSATRDVRKFLYSIIFQLACNLEDYQRHLMKLLQDCEIEDISTDEVAQMFIIQPLNLLIDGNRPRKYIVLDAIDEAVTDSTDMIEMILRLIEGMPRWMTVLITSRPEALILEMLQGCKSLCIDDRKKDVDNDLWNYVSLRAGDSSLAKRIIEKSDGSFLYAREAIKLLASGADDLESIPPGIGGAYYSNFRRIFPNDEEYSRRFRPFFELILAAQEQLSEQEVRNAMQISEDELRRILRRVRSYVFESGEDGNTVLQVFHKSFLDWLIADSNGTYRVATKNGDDAFTDRLLYCIETDGELSEYLLKYGLVHMGRKRFEDTDAALQKKILDALIQGTNNYGILEKEEEYIALYREHFGKNIGYYCHSMNYYKKTSGEKLRAEIQEALAYHQTQEASEQQQFEFVCRIAFSYFYAGLAEQSFELLTAERQKHSEAFWRQGSNEAVYLHALALSAHDLDNNAIVIQSAEKDIREYRRQKDYYSMYVSMVNLFDGYMALGQPEEADRIALKLLDYIEDRYYLHADDIIKICYANLLLTEGRIMESLDYYEQGLALAKKIQHWDYLYGSVWRELAIAKFGDRSCLTALRRYRTMAKQASYRYVISLADCFSVLAAHQFGEINADELKELYREILEMGFPGHILQAAASLMLDCVIATDVGQIVALTEKCEGVKGAPEIVEAFFLRFGEEMTREQQSKLEAWVTSHVRPITAYRAAFNQRLVADLDATVRLGNNNCARCGAVCCYDGIYVTPQDEKRITAFVNDHPDKFRHLPHPFIVDGHWPGMRSNRKTEKADYDGYGPSFPKHFTRTRCVFALPSGECSLQRAATDLQLHPWRIKPEGCWLFPLKCAEDGSLLPPTTDRDKDPQYVDESYPGYVSFLDCVKCDDNGKIWYEKYLHEIEYYRFIHQTER